MSFHPPGLTEKFGPLPVWAYMGIVAGVGFVLMRRNHAASAVPQINPSGATPGQIVSGSVDPTMFDPIAQINALSAAGTAGTEENIRQTGSFFSGLKDLLLSMPNSPNQVSVDLPGSGGNLSFGNGIPTFGGGQGNALQSPDAQQIADNFAALLQKQTYDYSQAGWQTFQDAWSRNHAADLASWTDIVKAQIGAGQAVSVAQIAAGQQGAAAYGGMLPAGNVGNPPPATQPNIPSGNYSAVRAACNVGNYSCVKSVAPWWSGDPVW